MAFSFFLACNSLTIFYILTTCNPVQSFDPCSKNFKLVTDVTIDDCETGYFFKPTGNAVHKCLPTCEKEYDFVNVNCTERGCPPGYYCPTKPPSRCQIDENSCFKYTAGDDKNPWKKSKWKPDCLIDGTWAPVQCKPDRQTGRCFCFDNIGNRIFGQAFAVNATNMTCACSRKKAELLKNDPNTYVSIHCDSLGNYQPLQCSSDQCWCVEPLNGEIISEVVSKSSMTELLCYSKNETGERYLTNCENEQYAKLNSTKRVKINETLHANLSRTFCDSDGSYGPYHIEGSEVRCIWRDKSSLGYAIPLANINLKTVTCNCARDKKIYTLNGLEHLLNCTSSGEYQPVQKTKDDKFYCVDADGERKSNSFPKLEMSDCLTYKQ